MNLVYPIFIFNKSKLYVLKSITVLRFLFGEQKNNCV